MIIQKILEYTEQETKEIYRLIIDKFDEGWELTRQEMERLVDLIERSLENDKRPTFKTSGTVLLSGDNVKINRELVNSLTGESVTEPYHQHDKDDSEDYPDEHSAAICEDAACSLVIEEESPPAVSKSMGAGLIEKEPEVESYENPTKSVGKSKERKKPGRKTNRDYSKYIGMFVAGYTKNQIIQDMVADWGITEGSANSYYFSKVKPEGELKQAEAKDRTNEKEKKKLADHLEKKIQVIPPATFEKPKDGKFFSDKDRERIQKQVGIK